MSKILFPLCYLRLVQKSAVFSYHGLYVRAESNVPVVSNNLHCYNTLSKQQVCCYMLN